MSEKRITEFVHYARRDDYLLVCVNLTILGGDILNLSRAVTGRDCRCRYNSYSKL